MKQLFVLCFLYRIAVIVQGYRSSYRRSLTVCRCTVTLRLLPCLCGQRGTPYGRPVCRIGRGRLMKTSQGILVPRITSFLELTCARLAGLASLLSWSKSSLSYRWQVLVRPLLCCEMTVVRRAGQASILSWASP